MLDYLWAGMILLGIVWAAIHGTMNEVTQAAMDSSREAVSLSITMLGVMSFWCGILEVGRQAGVLEQLSRFMRPVIRFLFPKLPKDHPAVNDISTNFIANILGLGSAATPAGLMAMKHLQELEEERGQKERGRASPEMCTFLIINISSLQLIPMTMIAYRSQYGSVAPMAIMAPVLVVTGISTVAAVIFCKIMDR